MSSSNTDNFTSSFMIWMPFISFSCLLVLARTSSIMLDRSGKNGHPGLVPDLRGKLYFSLNKDASCEFFIYDLYCIEVSSSNLTILIEKNLVHVEQN